jgi:hypothetical protein
LIEATTSGLDIAAFQRPKAGHISEMACENKFDKPKIKWQAEFYKHKDTIDLQVAIFF